MILPRLTTNKHTTGAAIVFGAIALGANIATTWNPTHADQIKHTADLLSKAAIGYGLLMARDSAPTPPEPPQAIQTPQTTPKA